MICGFSVCLDNALTYIDKGVIILKKIDGF